jgi:hypothetical protein
MTFQQPGAPGTVVLMVPEWPECGFRENEPAGCGPMR